MSVVGITKTKTPAKLTNAGLRSSVAEPALTINRGCKNLLDCYTKLWQLLGHAEMSPIPLVFFNMPEKYSNILKLLDVVK